MRWVFLFFCCFTCFFSFSQSKPVRLTENTIVKDSSGTLYPYETWRSMLMHGYMLKAVDPKNENTEFILVKLSDKQQTERLERMGKPRESAFFKTGDKFQPFKTKDIDGNKIDLKALEGKIIVLNFWFVDCPPCRAEIPDLNKLVDSFKTNDKLVFIAIALDSKSGLKSFLKKTPFNYTIIHEGKFLADKYGIHSFPTHVIIDTEGKIYFHTTGLSPNTVYWLNKTIKELLGSKGDTTVSSQ